MQKGHQSKKNDINVKEDICVREKYIKVREKTLT